MTEQPSGKLDSFENRDCSSSGPIAGLKDQNIEPSGSNIEDSVRPEEKAGYVPCHYFPQAHSAVD